MGIKSAPPQLQPSSTTPGTFSVTGWKVFRPGYHKERLFTQADCRAVVQNFAKLSEGEQPYLRAKAKLGHNTQQRMAQSLGLANVGRIVACREVPNNGGIEIDVDGIPVEVLAQDEDGKATVFNLKSEFDRGGYDDGSVELEYDLPDPDDPSKKIPGPVLTGVAFLGEEQPAVKGSPSPKVEFSHRGRAIAAEEFRTHTGGHRTRIRRIVFSEVDPMPARDEILTKLKENDIDVGDPQIAGMTDEALFALLKQLTSDSFKASMKAKFAADEPDPAKKVVASTDANPTPDTSKDEFKAFMADCTKRMGAMEQSLQDMNKMKPDIQAAAKFSKDYDTIRVEDKKRAVESAVNAAVVAGKLLPADKADQIELGMAKDNAVKFSAGDNAGKTPYEVWLAGLENRPASYMFSEVIDDAQKSGELSESAKRIMALDHRSRAAIPATK
jgi:hypothetical protein